MISPPERQRSIIAYWQVIVAIIVAVVLLTSTLMGWYVVSLGPIFTISVYGSVLLARKLVQQYYALKHNGKIMRVVRNPLVRFLVIAYPEYEEEIRKIARKHITYDDFKLRLTTLLPDLTEEKWKWIVRRTFVGARPRVSMYAPIFKLSFQEMKQLVESIDKQSYPVYRCYLVINSGPEDELHRRIHQFLTSYITFMQRSSETEFVVMYEPKSGKREAMFTGINKCLDDNSSYIYNVDGDTYLHPDAIANAIRVFLDLRPACLTGDIRVTNADENLLTALTYIRYFYAFNVERAAQSWLNQMTCMSGPFLAIEASVLRRILDRWYTQEFLGVRATFGDDRHLTTLVLLLGLPAIFVGDSIGWTAAPTVIKVWERQQLRWNKSANRENYILYTEGAKMLHWFIKFDLFYLTFFPFLVLGALIMVLYQSIFATFTIGLDKGIMILLPYIVSILSVTFLFQSLYGLILKRDLRYLLAPLYGYLWLRHLVPLKFRALWQMRNSEWGTK